MEARFTARQVWDVRAARALLHAVQRPSARRRGLTMLCAAALCWGLSYAPGMSLTGMVLAFALATVGVLELLFLERLWARPVYRDRRTRGTEQALAFGEDAVEARNEYGSTRYAYGAFRRFARCQGRYLLFYRAQQALIFTPESIASGDAAAFCAFIREKTGLTLENAR